ncbi:MAG: rRNA maturation RNase YbeY [Candidatus Nealsonbacteria bacterium RBG_13_38_11]|uniref:Endoribonuclease YbeY n=1 Tax=Candidatus Nealsonbacteria bacterium RBG_13_38_11 TaxID=1801662 RepID=A0A1G2DY57_9BACT|nr:MAG: rRNA maturation RNase YbeY [Candidatus Nealsonbacteria bacterium RBG_13_38_11]HXK32187.1 rRNA maturation RNase YbeY [Candidatus Paceibacterota bacterium]
MIEINNLTTLVDYGFLKKVAKIVLNKKKLDLSIVLVSSAEIKELNKKYRKKNKATDVLSFLYDDSGEIVICLKEVRQNAKKFGFPFKTELAKVLIHSVLHLLGYEHEKSKKQAAIMDKKENYYLNLWLKRKS